MKKRIVVLCIAMLLLLCSCARTDGKAAAPATEPETFSVRFEVCGSVVSQQKRAVNDVPKQFALNLTDGVLIGWKDADGQAVDPFTSPVEGEVTYQAVIRPTLSKHAPYLFVNSEGLLCPDLPLTRQGLSQALEALATADARGYFPQLLVGSVAITWEELTTQLGCFFEAQSVEAAFPQAEHISRAEFARGMNQLLGRGDGECFEMPDEYTIPSDVMVDREDVYTLLEAAVEHTPADQGLTWDQVELPTTYEPGFVNVDGWLYYVKEDGYLLKDGNVGTLYFGPDGRYTSSDPELDEMVADLLRGMIEENPQADRLELLRVIYDHCHQNHTYRRIFDGNPAYGATGWEIGLAKDMMISGKGNCYSFSAVFWALARGIGYEPRAISGKCLSDEQPHSWCILELDGEDYIFDPQWQYDYTRRGITHYDMFKIPMSKVYFWLYQWEE